MLLKIFKNRGTLPSDRSKLFAEGVSLLACERVERYEAGTATPFPLMDLLDAAERMACVSLLSARDVFELGDNPSNTSIGVQELIGLPSTGRPLDFGLIQAVGRCGLCDSDGLRRFNFAHRQFAEYLAGRRLALLLPHQARRSPQFRLGMASRCGWAVTRNRCIRRGGI